MQDMFLFVEKFGSILTGACLTVHVRPADIEQVVPKLLGITNQLHGDGVIGEAVGVLNLLPSIQSSFTVIGGPSVLSM